VCPLKNYNIRNENIKKYQKAKKRRQKRNKGGMRNELGKNIATNNFISSNINNNTVYFG